MSSLGHFRVSPLAARRDKRTRRGGVYKCETSGVSSISPPYNKTVSHGRAASASATEGGPNNGPEYPGEAPVRPRQRRYV